MNSLNPQSLKKLLVALGLSVLIIIVFLVLKVFLQEDKTITLKSFKTHEGTENKTLNETSLTPAQEEKKKIIILPSK